MVPKLARFGPQFGLVGGTAIALHLGHRRSIDFDLFSPKRFTHASLASRIRTAFGSHQVIAKTPDELTVYIRRVKLTFYHYPFAIPFPHRVEKNLSMPDLLTLAAMKAYALGGRNKWKDYVDLYFILQAYTLGDVVAKAEELFGGEFNEKLFREQLAYHEDMNYSEVVEYMPGFAVDNETVKRVLAEISLTR